MSKPDLQVVRLREDPDYFRSAVRFTSRVTTFAPRLVEKDYSCTVLLEYLSEASDGLVFKGGTCLAKVHADFYRLSEDLDFVIPVPVNSTRSQRSKLAAGVKKAVALLPERLPGFRLVDPLQGANNSTQYIAVVGYSSLIRRQEETIKIEVGLREPLLMPVVNSPARTIMLNPVSGKPLVLPVSVRSISKTEALAEKFRAALSRREAAIRDFFDIDYAIRRLDFHPQDPAFIQLIRHKLDVPGNDPVDVSGERLRALRQQLESRLKPVLRDKDFAEFNLDRAFKIVAAVAAMVR
ncbi:MAG: nucleotidyl transferase AbiEii/AbiGii toxin family protein [Candidatus Eisenbacteria bacterium]|nr:nucleotidyl transferase AbiEii/AbiGii toxin family protein [Candidatus Eisenbacteria bacterium]